MNHLKMGAAGVVGFLLSLSASAVPVNFSFTQTDASTGSGQVSAFTYDDGGGPINFAATPMPAATVVNPATGQYVGQQSTASNSGDENNTAVGLTWSGSVTATGTRGANTYKITIPLRFIAKQTQTPTDTNDYNWNVAFGDNPAGGNDAVSSANLRMAMWLSRDTTVDSNTDTANLFQRYTQLTHAFVAGQDTFTNADTGSTTISTTAVKDAQDGGDPQGTDAVGRDLAFYFGWRDQGGLNSGSVLVDTFQVGGLLDADTATITLVPEPSGLLACGGLGLLAAARRRRPR